MTPQRFLAFPQGSKLVLDEPGRWSGLLAKLEGKRIQVTVEPVRAKRSGSQNRKLFACYKEGLAGMEEYTGHTVTEVHEAYKQLYCPEKPVELPNGKTVMVKSTRLLTKDEFSAYLERVMAEFASYGIEVL